MANAKINSTIMFFHCLYALENEDKVGGVVRDINIHDKLSEVDGWWQQGREGISNISLHTRG